MGGVEETGFWEKVVGILVRVHSGHSRQVQTIAGITDWLLCTIGLKQGCVLSPLTLVYTIQSRVREKKRNRS